MNTKNLKSIFQKALFTNVIVFAMFFSQVLFVSALMIPSTERINQKMAPSDGNVSIPSLPISGVYQREITLNSVIHLLPKISLVLVSMAVLFFLNFLTLKKNQSESGLRSTMLVINIIVAIVLFLVYGFSFLIVDPDTVMMMT